MVNKFGPVIEVIFFLSCGLVGCSGDVGPDERQPEASVQGTTQDLAESVCCIDYSCPTNPDFDTTGCKIGGLGPGPAQRRCNAQCSVACEAGTWTCTPLRPQPARQFDTPAGPG